MLRATEHRFITYSRVWESFQEIVLSVCEGNQTSEKWDPKITTNEQELEAVHFFSPFTV